MVTFKINRDQANMISDYWIPYMIMSAEAEKNNHAFTDTQYLNALCIASLIGDMELMFKKKLVNSLSNKLSFKITIAQGCAFYVYLMKRPIDAINDYAYNFRQQLCDHLHKQLFARRSSAIPAEALLDYASNNRLTAVQ